MEGTRGGAEAGPGGRLLALLERPRAPETVPARLRRYLVEQGLAPGDRLPSETDLAAALGINRLTVREGLRALESLGLVAARPGAGWYVRSFDLAAAAGSLAQTLAFHPTALLDLLEIRRATEVDIVARLAGRLDPADLAALEEAVEQMRWQAARGRSLVDADAAFHRRLFAASGNLVALALVDVYFTALGALYAQGMPAPDRERAAAIAEAHGRIVAALGSGDPEGAVATLQASYQPPVREQLAEWLAGAGPAQRAVPAALLGRPETG